MIRSMGMVICSMKLITTLANSKMTRYVGNGVYERRTSDPNKSFKASGKWEKGRKSSNIDVEYEEGSYTGDFDVKKGRDGYGLMKGKDGSVYRGWWSDDMKDGIGSFSMVLDQNKVSFIKAEGLNMGCVFRDVKNINFEWSVVKICVC